MARKKQADGPPLYPNVKPGDRVLVGTGGSIGSGNPTVIRWAKVKKVTPKRLQADHCHFDQVTGWPIGSTGIRLIADTPENRAEAEKQAAIRASEKAAQDRRAEVERVRRAAILPRVIRWLKAQDDETFARVVGVEDLVMIADSMIARGELPESE